MSSPSSELEAFFGKPRDLRKKLVSPGRETAWMTFRTFHCTGSRLLVSDASSSMPDESYGLIVDLAPGVYEASVKGMDYGFEKRLSRVRYSRTGESVHAGGVVGKTFTDSAMTAICDLAALQESCGGDRSEIGRLVSEQAAQMGWFGVINLDRITFAAFSSGFGDGVFPVYEVLGRDGRVGIEIEFIAPETEYPEDLYRAAMQELAYRAKRTSGAGPEQVIAPLHSFAASHPEVFGPTPKESDLPTMPKSTPGEGEAFLRSVMDLMQGGPEALLQWCGGGVHLEDFPPEQQRLFNELAQQLNKEAEKLKGQIPKLRDNAVGEDDELDQKG